jgi:tetratricopeptide (TPR) repeat protein
MNSNPAVVHLTRAWGLIDGVEKSTEELRQHVTQYQAWLDKEEPPQIAGESLIGVGAIVGFAQGWARSAKLQREKSSLTTDLQLASQELDAAAKLSPEAIVESGGGRVCGIPEMRACILVLSGQIEMVWGTLEKAQDLFSQSLEITQSALTHFMLGLCYESQYRPKHALVHFEKCLELDPNGKFSVPALREANAMRNYKKQFRGSWGTFCLLLILWPFAVWYFFKNRK